MECSNYREMITTLLSGELDGEQKSLLEEHLSSCAGCRKEYESALRIWNLMGELPLEEPSEMAGQRFRSALDKLIERKTGEKSFGGLWDRLAENFTPVHFPRVAFGILLIMSGVAGGYFLRPANMNTAYNKQIDSLSSQVSELKQIMMLSFLKDQSASMRLQAVSYTDELNSVDKKVIEALLMTLNEDPNVNVRLATLEALVRLAGEPMVREGLVRSIAHQDSPLVQSAIADVMVKLNEKSSVDELKKLLSRKDLNTAVKTNIEQSIQKLI